MYSDLFCSSIESLWHVEWYDMNFVRATDCQEYELDLVVSPMFDDIFSRMGYSILSFLPAQ